MMAIGFGLIPVFVFLIFGLVIVTIIISLARNVSEWNYNNHQPVLTVEARVVSKRQHISHHSHMHNNNHHHVHHSTSSTYYVTFEFDSGDRIELRLPDHEYGMLVEGDFGRLTFQGTRYHGFERATTI